MICCYHLFRALDPDDKFPASPFNVKLNDLRYHLPLPPPVGDNLAKLLSPKGPFRRLDDCCNPRGIEIIRTKPYSFAPQCGYPTYVESEMRVDMTERGIEMGYVLQQAAANSIAAAEVSRFAIECWFDPTTGWFERDAAEWIMQNSAFFHHCGGFEIARVPYYFNDYQKDAVYSFVDSDIDDDEPVTLGEHLGRFAIFREMLERADTEKSPRDQLR